ncbi:MAG TPA: peroxiredoxin [Aggregatilineaceae bacterium]|nr:peroxiredoxin [Aggregatilineaceae bacterium]
MEQKNRSSQLSRMPELIKQFTRLEPQIQDSPEKQALSVLHAMIQELSRGTQRGSQPGAPDITTLYKQAPSMEGPAVTECLPVGTLAPDFELPDASGRPVRLSDYRGRQVVLVFYPLDWSPGCSQQLDLYQQEIKEFEQRGAKILGISIDSIYSHGAWATVRGITFPLLSDFNPKGAVARKYHVYREDDGFSDRALYIISPDGSICYGRVSPYLHHIPDIYDLFSALETQRG